MLARTVLECVARLRAFHVKPQRAQRVEAAGLAASPCDWFDAAGWRRLSVLNRSLGELSHFRMESRWFGAREALVALAAKRPDALSPAELIARGRVVEQAALLLEAEVLERLRAISASIANGYEALLTSASGRAPGSDLEDWLNDAWSLKGFDLGDPSFKPE